GRKSDTKNDADALDAPAWMSNHVVTYEAHRAMKPESEDAVFAALAHRGRRQMLDILLASPGCSVNQVAAHFDVSRIAVLKHLRVLAEAGLVLSEKRGRVRQLFFNSVPI